MSYTSSLLVDPFAETSMVHMAEAHPVLTTPRQTTVVKAHSVWAGLITGTAVPLVVNPLDKAVTHVMVATKTSEKTSMANALKNPYKGLSFAIVSNVAKFGALLETKRHAQTEADKICPESPAFASVLASSMAGVAETLVTAPFSYVKTQLYMGGTTGKILRDIPKGKMIQTLFAGCGASMGRNVVFAGICFPLVPVIEEGIRSDSSPLKSVSHPAQAAVAGAVSGAVATLASNPFTVVGTRAKVGTISKSSIDQFRDIITKEGPAALWKGVSIAIPRMVVVAALTASIDQTLKTTHLLTPEIEDGEVIDELPEILDLPFGS